MKKVIISKEALNQKLALINALDFTMLKSKLTDKEEGKGWNDKMCDAVEVLYKNFLCLILKYPGSSIVPTKQIDDFWHAHILDTRRYHEDCQNIFGYYLHHYPYFGLRGEQDAKNLQDSFFSTKRLWEKEFGTARVIEGIFCGLIGDGEDNPSKPKPKPKPAECGTDCATCAGRCRPYKLKSSLCSSDCKVEDEEVVEGKPIKKTA